MATELIHINENNTLGFGDCTLKVKTKVEDFEFQGDLYKVKTFCEITKLEKNGMFIYESVPGTLVNEFKLSDEGLYFQVYGEKDAQITVELEPQQEYQVCVDDNEVGVMRTNISGKLSVSIELSTGKVVSVLIKKMA